ncbi:class I SAM-dependent methyltransferase [Planctomycetaceae bacterium SH139]
MDDLDLGYIYGDNLPSHSNAYLWPSVFRTVRKYDPSRIFDLGCGNGALAFRLTEEGRMVTGVDPSLNGIRIASQQCDALSQ